MPEDKKDNEIKNNQRRKALKTIGVTGVLAGTVPATWSTPVVKSVLLPAHAQTSEPQPCQAGDCSPLCMNVNLLSAVVETSGALFVLGETQIAGGSECFVDDSKSIVCEVIDNGTVIDSDDRTSAGSCSTGSIDGCLVSCSMLVPDTSHTLQSGDLVTLRVTFNGICVCSDVTTVT